MHLATPVPLLHTPRPIPNTVSEEGTMKFRLSVILSALLFSAVPIAMAQDAATDVKKGAEATGHETKVVAKDTAKATEKVADKTGHETKVVAKDTAKGAEKTGSAVKKGAEDTGHGLKKVGDKIADKPADKPADKSAPQQ
jgi:hypothetical protein